MELSRQESWSALLFPSPGDLPDPGIKLRSSAMQADSLPSEPSGKPNQETKPCGISAESSTDKTSVTAVKEKYLKGLDPFS